MDVLWPGEAGAKVANRFSVALSTLRGVLDPAREHPSDYFVFADRDVCRLDLDHTEVDVEAFLRDAARGLALARTRDPAAGELLRRAESAYSGDFLEENAYDDWALAVRDEARDLYLRTCRALAEESRRGGNAIDASRYLRRLLERDPYDENAHLNLVQVLVQDGHHGEARRVYGTYVNRMGEIGVEAVPFPDVARS
jgi:DNA-binding SARP family transcriptional activator